jgi:hypothetical protein
MDRTATVRLKIKFEHTKARVAAWFLGFTGFRLNKNILMKSSSNLHFT